MSRVAQMSVLAGLLGASSAWAGTVRMDLSYHAANGLAGKHTATVLDGFVGMTDPTGPANSFETFCLEHNEYFYPGGIYNAVIDTAARNGGVSGGVNGADPISPATAFLYTQFRSGNLGFNSLTNGNDANALQDAIWYLEGEIPSVSGQALSLVNLANNSGWTGIGDVRVINIYDGNGGNAQSQLTMVPLPPAAWAGLAMVGGVVGHQIRRRRVLGS